MLLERFRRHFRAWVDLVGLQSVLFVFMTLLCGLMLIGISLAMFPEACGLDPRSP